MNIIVAGGRTFDNYSLLKERLDFYFKEIKPTIICGEAKGADTLGRKYATENGLRILSCPANWKMYGKAAGYIRNEQMADMADGLVAFWNGKSRGTKHMIDTMCKAGKQVRIVKYE